MAKKLTNADRKMYQAFMVQFHCCMACGWNPARPIWRDWMIGRLENAHVVGGAGRRHDRRAIVRLCAGCHRLSHGDRILVRGIVLPVLSLENLLWLKQENDPANYDVEFLQSLRIRHAEKLTPAPLPRWFLEERSRCNR